MYYLANKPKNRILFANLVHFFHFLPLYVFLVPFFLRFLTPLYAHTGAQGLHMDPNPEFDELPRQPTKEHILSANLVHFFSFSPFSSFFGHVFWLFFTPLCAYMSVKGIHLDLNSEFYHLSLESEKKRTLIIDYFNFFSFFFQYVVVFAHFGSSFSPLLKLKVPPGSPSGTVPIISCITSPTN